MNTDREKLARMLFEALERLDPTEDGNNGWDGLTDWHRDLYKFAIDAVIATIHIQELPEPPTLDKEMEGKNEK